MACGLPFAKGWALKVQDYLQIKAAAAFLGVSSSTLRNWERFDADYGKDLAVELRERWALTLFRVGGNIGRPAGRAAAIDPMTMTRAGSSALAAASSDGITSSSASEPCSIVPTPSSTASGSTGWTCSRSVRRSRIWCDDYCPPS